MRQGLLVCFDAHQSWLEDDFLNEDGYAQITGLWIREKNKKKKTDTSVRKKQVKRSKIEDYNHVSTAFEPVRLADSIQQLMKQRIQPMRKVYINLTECWDELLPEELKKRCRILQIMNGNPKVQADSPSYLYELKLSSNEILEKLQSCCPGARIKKIDFVVG
jgi:hypothetical protein